MAESINLDDIGAKLGAYLRDPDVKRTFVTNMALEPDYEGITPLAGVIDEAPLPNLMIGDPWAAVSDTSDISGKFKADIVSADARILKVKECLIPLFITPTKLHASYLGYLDKENMKQKGKIEQAFHIPEEEFIMNEIAKQAKSKLMLNAIWKGVRNNAGTTSATLFDGFLKKISDAITATELDVVATGAITQENVIEKLLMVYDELPEETKGSIIHIHVAPQIFDWVARLYSPITNPSLIATDLLAMQNPGLRKKMPLPGTNAILMREPGMGTSQRIVCTVANNLFFGYNSDPNSIVMDIQKVDLSLKFIMYCKMGVECGTLNSDHGLIVVNNQA